MNQSNQIVLKMVLASPVGQALSDADRIALTQILETTDAREVQGWLGDQIKKAAQIAKGDYVGHPFRGNQYADSSGASTGGASSGPRFGAGSGAKTSSLKEGDFADIDTENANYVGTILGIKDGVVTFDDVDKGEIKFKLKDVTTIDGDKVDEDDSASAGKKRVAEVDAKLSDTKRMRETSVEQERLRLGLPKEETAGKPPMSMAGRRTVAAANRSLKEFREIVDELEAVEASRDQIIDDLVDEEGVSRKNATQDVDDDIAVLRYAVNQSKFKGQESETEGETKVRERSEQAANAERGRQRQEREQAASAARRGKLIPVNDDNIDKTLKDAERKEFAQNVKEAKTAVKTTRALIDMLRQKVNEKATRSMLGSKRLDVVQANLQAAQEETDRFEDILNDNSKASIRSAVAISAMGTDLGETVKGFIRESAQLMRVDIPARDEAALQTAADKNYGVSGDKYDIESVYDQL